MEWNSEHHGYQQKKDTDRGRLERNYEHGVGAGRWIGNSINHTKNIQTLGEKNQSGLIYCIPYGGGDFRRVQGE